MASYGGSEQSEAAHDRLNDGNWSDTLQEVGVSCASRAQPATCRDCDDHSSQYVDNYSPPHFELRHRARHSASHDVDDGDKDSDVDITDVHYWHKAGRTLRAFLSQTSETSLLFSNDDVDIASGREPADLSVPKAHCQTAGDCDLCSDDCQSLRRKCCSVGSGSLAVNDLVLDDDLQTSFLPLFTELKQKISCLDTGCHEELHHTTRRMRGRAKSKGEGKLLQLSTWSELSSSEESDNRWLRPKMGHRRRRCSGSRRRKSYGRCLEDWASEEPSRSLVNHHGSNRKRRKNSMTEKTSPLIDGKLLSDMFLPLEATPTEEQTCRRHGETSFADFLADVESNATDSENSAHVSDDGEDNGYDNTMKNDETLSSVAVPLACSYHCIPPEHSEEQTARLPASSVDCSPHCDKVDHCASSDDEFFAELGNVRISHNSGYHSSCSSRDKEDDSDMNVVSSDCDRELTSVAMTTAALSMAAAAAANDADEGDDDDDGLRMCEVETRPLRPEFYSYRNNGLSSWDDCDDIDVVDDDDDGLLALDSDADDEFECDCPVCLMHQQNISDSWQERERLLPTTALSSDNQVPAGHVPAGYYDDDDDSDLVSFTFTGPDYSAALNESITINSIFQDVVIQMLQYYPSLLTSQAPPPLTDAEFSRLPSLTICREALGEESSCSICLCQFEDSEDAKILSCHHMFHTLCIQAWLNKAGTCPVCRQSVVVATPAAAASRHGNDDGGDTMAQ